MLVFKQFTGFVIDFLFNADTINQYKERDLLYYSAL